MFRMESMSLGLYLVVRECFVSQISSVIESWQVTSLLCTLSQLLSGSVLMEESISWASYTGC